MSEQSSPPRRGHGCLWGCLLVLLVISLPGFVAAWFLYYGFRHDPALQAAMELVRHDGIAHHVLGDGIHVTGVESHNFSFAFGMGSQNDYSVDLAGTLGDGRVDVRSHSQGGTVKFDSVQLTGPDGQRYDLLHHSQLPAAPGNAPNLSDTI